MYLVQRGLLYPVFLGIALSNLYQPPTFSEAAEPAA